MNHWGWRPYVPVAQRKLKAKRLATQLAKQGKALEPIEVQGRAIARTFWGKAWCDNLESYSDFANRLPRGRTYVRNGSVIDLKIDTGTVSALVSGSDIYKVSIRLTPLKDRAWNAICADCSDSIDSLLDLLAGKFDTGVMQRLTRKGDGLFPKPDEIQLDCSCPDWASMCKHVAAVLYGVGSRLDDAPEMLFVLRNVDHSHLLGKASLEAVDQVLGTGSSSALDGEDLSALFGIELESTTDPNQNGPSAQRSSPVSPSRSPRKAAGKTAKKGAGRKRKSSTSGLASQNRAVTKTRGTQEKAATKKKAKETKKNTDTKNATDTRKTKVKQKATVNESSRGSSSKEASKVVATKRKSAKPKKKAAQRTSVRQESAGNAQTQGVKGASRKAKSSSAKRTRTRAGSQRAAKQ